MSYKSPFTTITWDEAKDCCVLIDQTKLPLETEYMEVRDSATMWDAIKRLCVRGAPAIGIAGGYGLYLGARQAVASGAFTAEDFRARCNETAVYLNSSRPTAVNLDWALQRMLRVLAAQESDDVNDLLAVLLKEARAIEAEDAEICRLLGENGQELLENGSTVLTHCNAGGLATSQLGTALAPIITAHNLGKTVAVFADETRPLLQGARLTTWELMQAGVPVTLICDGMAASVMAAGKVQAVIVGTDRTAANGDVANKIGTYGVALAAAAHGVPFYVAAPTSSVDLSLASGAEIPIEEREPGEITEGFGRRTAPEGVEVYNPAFDVTPAKYVTAIITEAGVVRPPYETNLRAAVEKAQGKLP